MNKKCSAALALLCLSSGLLLAQSPVTLSVDHTSPGASLPPDFIGLSYEMSLVDSASNGAHFFSPKNAALVAMFRTLGVKSLRVGGNSADRLAVKPPDQSDIDQLFAFAQATGVKVIYTLRLNGGDPLDAARTAGYIMDNYQPQMAAFAIGNEPDKLTRDYAAYRDLFRSYMAAITAAAHAPNAVFCGPSTMQKNVAWAGNFAADFAADKHVVLVTQHEYPAGSGRRITGTAAGCEKLLSSSLLRVYGQLHDAFVPTVLAGHQHYRLEEANSFSNGGAAGVSDSYASALWGLDYMFWWASHRADGINFHTSGYSGDTPTAHPMKYVVFWNAPDGFSAHPLAYAMKAFDLGGHGRLVPVSVNSNQDRVNLAAYAAITKDNLLYVTLINKESSAAHNAMVTLKTGSSAPDAQAIYLTVADGNIAATSGITLGGAPISHDGHWDGVWRSVPCQDGQVSIKLPAASAVVVRLATSIPLRTATPRSSATSEKASKYGGGGGS